ncbi:hypothetical protein [Pseudoalteromonas luteoviolacea]|uniref:hypothetical protein n=1 Tax=Pseudoalteromonas luteoviolacea TaxID=43657 RepID=UPI001B38B6C9|nr:hypothetical protein [Pseudoalteromonas luteoviolacea]MBQ4837884.1 hypothetical protein [Pseudoalteromonas luteoviolacea]
MKNIISATLIVASTYCATGFAQSHAIDVDKMLEQTFELIQNNENQAALSNLNWLAKHGTAHDPRFHNTFLDVVQHLWLNFAYSYTPAWKSYDKVYRSAKQALIAAPQNCSAFDIALSFGNLPHNATDHITHLENTEQQFPATWQRCWTAQASSKAIGFISEPLITAYVGDLSDHFKIHIVDQLNAVYRDCDDLPTETLVWECRDAYKLQLTSASAMYREAAMILHDDVSEAGQIGGHTISLMLQWQAHDNR